MTHEIERKFLVRSTPSDLPSGTPIRQGYVAVEGDRSLRVRDHSGELVLTVKGGRGRVRTEVELPVSREQFDALWQLTEGRRVEKTRHRVEQRGHTIEVDTFEGSLEGLTLAEVEFTDTGAAAEYQPPGWFGPDVTDDPRYTNASLALNGRPTGSD